MKDIGLVVQRHRPILFVKLMVKIDSSFGMVMPDDPTRAVFFVRYCGMVIRVRGVAERVVHARLRFRRVIDDNILRHSV